MSLADALTNNSTLEELNLNNCSFVTSTGWLAFSRVLGSPRSSLKKLELCESSIDDDVITAFANDLSGNETLEELDLDSSRSVTYKGWGTFSRVLGSPRSVLKKLDLSNNSIYDDQIHYFCDELRGNENSQLTHLVLEDTSGFYIMIKDFGWWMISNLLNDDSSIDATWSSNHTLTYLRLDLDSEDVDENYLRFCWPEIPKVEVPSLLKMNEHSNKKEVARKKVILNHFSDGFDVNAILGFQKRLLPRTISWFGRDSLGYSAVYKIMRSMPELCQNDEKI